MKIHFPQSVTVEVVSDFFCLLVEVKMQMVELLFFRLMTMYFGEEGFTPWPCDGPWICTGC